MVGLIPVWKRAPFLRLLIPLMIGIVLQWNFQIPNQLFWILLFASSMGVACSFLLPVFKRVQLSIVTGIFISFLFLSIGGLLSWYKNIEHQPNWFGKIYQPKQSLLITLQETPIEKTNSYKANAKIEAIWLDSGWEQTKGEIIIYFKKDSAIGNLKYGTQLITNKPLQPIKNAGNPGGFDYKRYSLFQNITHQVYLKGNDFALLPATKKSVWKQLIFSGREKVIFILKKFIPGEKEQGLAEALLIGYKDDLDKNLVESYSNTGVVHIIAISGMHLALIYWLLGLLTKPLQRKRSTKSLAAILVISGLWLFSLLAGGQASVLRSAVMFTCMVAGNCFSKRSSIYNSLAFSAFILLCYNPFWLWDVGFQLSYAAVLSIVIFMQPIYHLFYIKNKALDYAWKLNAVTIAAQLLTTPLSIYHFHQFPNFFLLTNFLAVPLSGIILLGEIFLCAVSFIPFIAKLTGKILSFFIGLMNSWIEAIEKLPFSLWDGLQISIWQALALIALVVAGGYWLLEKKKAGLVAALFSLLAFISLRSISFWQANKQQKLIVYNVPKHQAIDVVLCNKYFFVGDSNLLADDFVRNFHLKPSRILQRIEPAYTLPGLQQHNKLLQVGSKRIVVIDSTVNFESSSPSIPIDLLIISKNPKLYLEKLFNTFSVKRVVCDGSVPPWKIGYWKKDCEARKIPFHNVSEQGAFVMTID